MEKGNEVNNLEIGVPGTIQPQTNVPQQYTSKTPEQQFTEPTFPQNTDKKWLLPSLIALVVVAFGIAGYFAYQNFQLKKEQPSIGQATPTPTSNIPSPTADQTANWKTYTNQVFTIKLPEQFEYDTRYSNDPSNMHFSWSEPKNTTPIKSIDMVIGYMQGDPNLMSCKTDEECFQGYSKSFSVAGYNKISIALNGKQVNGFETSNNASNVLIYQNFYPLSHNGKLFTVDIQMSAPSVEQAKQLVPQVNKILSTLKFISETSPTTGWETYSNSLAGFNIKYPTGWRKVETKNWTGFGPQEIGEDVVWGVSFYNKSEKTVAQIKDEVGKQFPDRKQTEETISFNGLSATKVTTTTNQFADWYSVSIIIDSGNMLYAVGNGAQTDKALNEMIAKRTGKGSNISFEDFYTSFKLVK